MDLGGDWLAAASTDELRRVFADPDLDDVRLGADRRPRPLAVRSGVRRLRRPGPLPPPLRPPSPAPGRAVLPDLRRASSTKATSGSTGSTWATPRGTSFPTPSRSPTALAARSEHLLAVEVACARPADRTAKRNLTGIFQHWDCIDPDWNPGGIWAPGRRSTSGPVRIRSLRVLCREATAERATLELQAELDATAPAAGDASGRRPAGRHDGRIRRPNDAEEHALAAGVNQVRWRSPIERPDLWWPHALGAQPLYEVDASAPVATSTAAPRSGDPRDRPRPSATGLRPDPAVRSATSSRPSTASGSSSRAPTAARPGGPWPRPPPTSCAGDVTLARAGRPRSAAGPRPHQPAPSSTRPPTARGCSSGRTYPCSGATARSAARPMTPGPPGGHAARPPPLDRPVVRPQRAAGRRRDAPAATLRAPRTVRRFVAGQVLPSWNKTALDRSIRRALERADGSRQVVAHSGILPHPAWGTDSHLYFGWYHGDERDLPSTLARLPVLARFVSEFGAQAVPETAEFMHPERWPDLDWDHLEGHHCLQRLHLRASGCPPELADLRRLAGGHPGLPGQPAAPSHRDAPPAQVPARPAGSASSCWPTPSRR